MSPNDDFAHKYAGGTNQYGTKGAENPNDFHGYMNDGMSPGAGEGFKSSPMDLMSTPHNPNFGPPGKMGPPAAENFGPPAVNETYADNNAKFGAPGSDMGNLRVGGPGHEEGAGEGANAGGGVGDDNKNADNSGDGGNGGETKGSGSDKKYTYAKVEKMMIDNMLQRAMANMKIKSPDPTAWK